MSHCFSVSRHDLSSQRWRLVGLTPEAWKLKASMEIGAKLDAEVRPIPASIPCSVQAALRAANLIPDWNFGLNHRLCEWVENRHWLFECDLPAEMSDQDSKYCLELAGLDYKGCVFFQGKVIGEFDSAFRPWTFDFTRQMVSSPGGKLGLLFLPAPRWMGQFGRTSQITDQKARFNYGWDWIPRMVQTGVTGPVTLHQWKTARLAGASAEVSFSHETGKGSVRVFAEVERASGTGGLSLECSLRDGDVLMGGARLAAPEHAEATIKVDHPEAWWPNGMGEPKLYQMHVRILDSTGAILDERQFDVGFRHIEWRACEGSPPAADPWLCVVNGRPVFLQGINWTPLLPNYADASPAQYEKLLRDYQRMGCNTLRVWGGAAREQDCFYRLCDELGFLVWQEFPLSSAGIENAPPRTGEARKQFIEAARWMIRSLRHHPSVFLWCGGNELTEDHGDRKIRIPVTLKEPLIKAFDALVSDEDPLRRFVSTSPSGPRFCASAEDYGKGLHWDTHGPWALGDDSLEDWSQYWKGDDSLFRSEVGCPGASSAELIEKYAGDEAAFPTRNENALWRRTPWWTEWDAACRELGHEPSTLWEYVEWSQRRQAEALLTAAKSCKDRFPRCGGFLVWMGHDAFPVTANTAVIDFDGAWKPAAFALRDVFLTASTQ